MFAAIRKGDYIRCGQEGSVDVEEMDLDLDESSTVKPEDLNEIARQIEALKREIEREKAKQSGRSGF
jgi:hypothetical protein